MYLLSDFKFSVLFLKFIHFSFSSQNPNIHIKLFTLSYHSNILFHNHFSRHMSMTFFPKRIKYLIDSLANLKLHIKSFSSFYHSLYYSAISLSNQISMTIINWPAPGNSCSISSRVFCFTYLHIHPTGNATGF